MTEPVPVSQEEPWQVFRRLCTPATFWYDETGWKQRADAFIAALRAQQAADAERERIAWQPIETAPKDGSDVLLAGAFGIRIGNWGPHGRHRRKPVEYNGRLSNFERAWSEVDPTHWMPLPAPPERRDDREQGR